MKIWTVDAFTTQLYKGNPAAVVVVDEFPDKEMCLNIASEMNLSETAFVKKLGDNHFHIRWFTPKVEIKLCGHATLATAHTLKEQGLFKGNEVTFTSLSGPLKVICKEGAYTLDFPLQKTSEIIEVPSCFGTIVQAVQAFDDIIVELQSEDEVRAFIPDYNLLSQIECRGIIVTGKGKGPYDFVSRFFCPKVGLHEDPVTGSAHCKLADYWQKKLNKTSFLAYQASPRGGEVKIDIVGERVHLTGSAITFLEGVLKTD